MKQWLTIETKSNVVIYYEDADNHKRESIRCTYQEAWGLLHALERLRDVPAFAIREPRPRTYNVSEQPERKVTTVIEYEAED